MTHGSGLITGLKNPTLIPQARCADPNIITSQQAIGQIPNNIEAVLLTLQQRMMNFMFIIKTTMQILMQNQNILIKMLAPEQSKRQRRFTAQTLNNSIPH